MWRRVTFLSTLIPKSQALTQANYGLKFMEPYSSQAKSGTPLKERSPFITFVLGGPGSGKGTQCEKIVETFGWTHFSSGDLLRKEISSNFEQWAMIKQGKMVSPEVIVKLLQNAMESSENDRFLIDGFPRTEKSRIVFEKIVGLEPGIVLFFDCPESEMVRRVLRRNQGRVEDNITTVKKRLRAFRALTLPVINYYSTKGKLFTINALGAVDDIFEQVRPVFDAHKVT